MKVTKIVLLRFGFYFISIRFLTKELYKNEIVALGWDTLYYMQIGYYAIELRETLEERLALVPDYLRSFAGREASAGEIEAFRRHARARRRELDPAGASGRIAGGAPRQCRRAGSRSRPRA